MPDPAPRPFWLSTALTQRFQRGSSCSVPCNVLSKKSKSAFMKGQDRNGAFACTRCQRKYAFQSAKSSLSSSVFRALKKSGVTTLSDCIEPKPTWVKYSLQWNDGLSACSSSPLSLGFGLVR